MSDEQLDRIEAKLDAVEESVAALIAALIAALAEDEADDRPTHDLDGMPIPDVRTGDDTL